MRKPIDQMMSGYSSVIVLLLMMTGMSLAISWPPAFTVQGMITIPFAEIEEPFMAYVDFPNKRSRIDYYGGMDQTYQFGAMGDVGTMFKIVPMVNSRLESDLACFQVNGTSDAHVQPQSILPDMTGFKNLGKDMLNGEECEKWQKVVENGDKVNKYTMWVKIISSAINPNLNIAIPLHYEMKGFNSLLGSHYDHYYLTYRNFSPDPPRSEIFDEYQKHGKCGGMPGPGAAHEHVYHMNPAKEFVDHSDEHVDSAFEEFKSVHGKAYGSAKEHTARRDIFRQNMRLIHSHNRKHTTYEMNSNHMADWTAKEMKMMRGRLHSEGYNGGQEFKHTAREVSQAPEEMDWRLYGAVSPVKDQSMCGSCWSFGTVGSLEGTMFLKTGKLTRLSEQALVDCSWEYGNNGCDGGEDFRVYKYMIDHGGIPTDDAYGPYMGQDGYCHVNDVEKAFQIKGFVNVTSNDNDALKVAIAKHGPISVGIDASHKSLSFYSKGVYYEEACNNTPDGLDHAVLAVGYGELNGEKYWLVKNSWSTYWGNDGYVLMAQKDNNCGVATSPTFAVPA